MMTPVHDLLAEIRKKAASKLPVAAQGRLDQIFAKYGSAICTAIEGALPSVTWGSPRRAVMAALFVAYRDGGSRGLKARVRELRKGIGRQDANVLKKLQREAVALCFLKAGEWPPPPERGDSYNDYEADGYTSALRALPVVREATAAKWGAPRRIRSALLDAGVLEDIGDPESGHAFWSGGSLGHQRHTLFYPIIETGWRPTSTPGELEVIRAEVEKDAISFIREIDTLADPTTWSLPAAEMAKRLCAVDGRFVEHALHRIHGVKFGWGRKGRDEVSSVCDGSTTIAALKRERAQEDAASREREQAFAKLRGAYARELLAKVFYEPMTYDRGVLNRRALKAGLAAKGHPLITLSVQYGGRKAGASIMSEWTGEPVAIHSGHGDPATAVERLVAKVHELASHRYTPRGEWQAEFLRELKESGEPLTWQAVVDATNSYDGQLEGKHGEGATPEGRKYLRSLIRAGNAIAGELMRRSHADDRHV